MASITPITIKSHEEKSVQFPQCEIRRNQCKEMPNHGEVYDDVNRSNK